MGTVPTQHREEFGYLLIPYVVKIQVYKSNYGWELDVLTNDTRNWQDDLSLLSADKWKCSQQSVG